MRRRLTTLLVLGTMVAAMVVAGAGSALGQSFEIVERGSGHGATVLQGQFEDLPDEFTLGEFGLDVCGLQGDTLVTSENSGFFRRIATPSGEETRQVFIRREISFTQDGVQYTGTLQQVISFEDLSGTSGHETMHLRATGSDDSTFRATVFADIEGGTGEETRHVGKVVCPGS